MTSRSPTSFEFTPTNMPADVLEARTVGRYDLLERIAARIQTAVGGGGKAHTLVVGARGSGKTHVLTVAAHRAAAAVDESKLLIIAPTEDAEGIVSYADLLFTMIERALVDGAVGGVDASATLAAARASRRDSDALEDLLRTLCGERVVVLVLENLDRVFDDIGIAGQRQLRAFVETWRQMVMLASTPLLFSAVSDREEPWFGSFIPEHLTEMDVDDGTRLLVHLAAERGDDELVRFLAGDRARDRLQAVAHIAGGSPRMWVMLSGCLTTQLLDDLVPLIERLLENLVPYYQARLRELPGNERKLVVELARTSAVDREGSVVFRPQGARTVSDLAASCGMDRNVASGSLRRLMDARWVRLQDVPGGDRRTSWYELREPLFRHHLQHRETGGGTLALVVQLLKAFYSHPERIALLGGTARGSLAERHMLASLEAPAASDDGYNDADPDVLLGEARRWDGVRTALGALERCVAEAAVKGARGEDLGEPSMAEAAQLVRAAHRAASDESLDDEVARVRRGLVAARDLSRSGDAARHAGLSLLAAGWTGAAGDAEDALACLSEIGDLDDGRLALAVAAERAFFLWSTGERDRALNDGRAALEGRRKRLGEDDPDTLRSRSNVADWTGELGDHAVARAEFDAVAEAQGRLLGAEHPHTLMSRHNAAFQAGELGDHAVARAEFVAVAEAQGRLLGAEHPHTLMSRHNAAYQAGELGDRALARAEFVVVAEARGRVLGSEHPDTLMSRHNAAYQAGELGDPALARAELLEIAAARRSALGSDDYGTLNSIFAAAEMLARAGDPIAALGEIVSTCDALGSAGGDSSLRAAEWIGSVLTLVGEPSTARAAMAALEPLEADTMLLGLTAAALPRATADPSEHAAWLAVWSGVLEGAQYDVVGRVFGAAAELISGRPAPASALPDEERRLAYLIAGLDADDRSTTSSAPDAPAADR